MPKPDPNDLWCFTWIQEAQASPGADRMAAIRAAMWQPGDAVSVCFLDGAKRLKDRVEEAAHLWTGPQRANLRFVFQKKTDALIRITFNGRGSWSVLGTSCRNIAAGQPTMNFGWLSADTEDDLLRGVVLHEFGHAIGLVHEHQSPATRIRWDKATVRESLSGAPNFWTNDQITRNLFTPFTKKETNFSKFDPQSIMVYPIPPSWTLNGFTTPFNTQLSAIDVAHVQTLYPWT